MANKRKKRHDCPDGVHEQITLGRYTLHRNDYDGPYLEVEGVREDPLKEPDPIPVWEIESVLDDYFKKRWS